MVALEGGQRPGGMIDLAPARTAPLPSSRHERTVRPRPLPADPTPDGLARLARWLLAGGQRRRAGCRGQGLQERHLGHRPDRDAAATTPDALGSRRERGRLPARRLAALHLGTAGSRRQARRGQGQATGRAVAAARRGRRGATAAGTAGRRGRHRHRAHERRRRARRTPPSRCCRLRRGRGYREGQEGRRRRRAAVRALPDPLLGSLPGAARRAPVHGGHADLDDGDTDGPART